MNSLSSSSLTKKIVTAMILGILVGLSIQTIAPGSTDYYLYFGFSAIGLKDILVNEVFHAGGQLFLNSLKMLVVPLVFVSLVCGTSSLRDLQTLGRIASKTMLIYISTTALAIGLAIALALLFKPGAGVSMQTNSDFTPTAMPSTVEVIISMIPSNPIEAMAKGEMIQIIVFSVLIGISIAALGAGSLRVQQLFDELNKVVMKLVEMIMRLSPYGIFFLLAKQFTLLELKDISSLGWYFSLVFLALLIHVFLVYGSFIYFLGRLNPFKFFIKMKETALFAFSTSSSSATIASNLSTATNKLGIDNKVASFTIPLGATINMDGTAIMQGVATVFIAQVYDIELSIANYLMVILTATLASIGTAGVPGVGLVMLAMVLTAVGLPVEGIALIIGLDRLLDMARTAVNITGDAMVSCLVARSEKCLNTDIFTTPHPTKGE